MRSHMRAISPSNGGLCALFRHMPHHVHVHEHDRPRTFGFLLLDVAVWSSASVAGLALTKVRVIYAVSICTVYDAKCERLVARQKFRPQSCAEAMCV